MQCTSVTSLVLGSFTSLNAGAIPGFGTWRVAAPLWAVPEPPWTSRAHRPQKLPAAAFTGAGNAVEVDLVQQHRVGGDELFALQPVQAEAGRCRRIECGERIGCEVGQGYGMTELSPVSHATPSGMFKPGSVGVTVPNTEVNIVDPFSQSLLGVDEDGEVWIRGPQVMKGYWNNESATRNTIDDDGWLHTGDVGHIDADNCLDLPLALLPQDT